MAPDLYVAWQDQVTRTWHTIAKLRRTNDGYEFVFTKGVQRLRSVPLDLFRMDVNKKYRSTELIPLFKNRLLSRSRSDSSKIRNWLNLTGQEDEFESLSKLGLIPGTDSVMIYPEPTIVSQRYHVDFFVHGIRHMHEGMVAHCDAIHEGDKLLPLLDVQNPVDPNAVTLRSPNDFRLIGYVPAFYASDVREILLNPNQAKNAHISIVKNNKDAPLQIRLLCHFEAPVPHGFRFLDTDVHKPLLEEAA